MFGWFTFYTFEKVNDPDIGGLRNQVQTGKRNIHPAILERADLCAMKSRKVRELVLRPAPLQP
jgi:hypothetical protein